MVIFFSSQREAIYRSPAGNDCIYQTLEVSNELNLNRWKSFISYRQNGLNMYLSDYSHFIKSVTILKTKICKTLIYLEKTE